MQFQTVQADTNEQDIDLPKKNAARVAAGRVNVLRRRTWTAKQRAAARERALRQQPWQHATGPRTPAGRAKSAANLRQAAIRQLLRRAAGSEATQDELLLAVVLLTRVGFG